MPRLFHVPAAWIARVINGFLWLASVEQSEEHIFLTLRWGLAIIRARIEFIYFVEDPLSQTPAPARPPLARHRAEGPAAGQGVR